MPRGLDHAQFPMCLLTKLDQLQDNWSIFSHHSSKYDMWYVCISFLFLSVLRTCRIHACLHVYWYMSVFRLTCLCVYVDGDWRLMSSVLPSCILYIVSVLYIVAGSLTKSQSLQFWGSLANQLASGISCLHPLMLGLQAGGYAYMAFPWVLGL